MLHGVYVEFRLLIAVDVITISRPRWAHGRGFTSNRITHNNYTA